MTKLIHFKDCNTIIVLPCSTKSVCKCLTSLFLLGNYVHNYTLCSILDDSLLRILEWRTNERTFKESCKLPRSIRLYGYSNNDLKTLACLFIESYMVSDSRLDVNNDDDFSKLANELDSERISKTNKQREVFAQRINVSLLSQGHIAANPASEGHLLRQQSTGMQTQLQRETRAPVHTLSMQTQITFVCVLKMMCQF